MPQSLEQTTSASPEAGKDFLPLNGTDYVEFYVGNARQSAHYYRSAFGFRLAAYRGPETGTRDRASYVLAQNRDPPGADNAACARTIRLPITSGCTEMACMTSRCGWTTRRQPGARPPGAARAACASRRPCATRTARSVLRRSQPTAIPFTPLSNAANYHGAFLPGFRKVEGDDPVARPAGLTHIDHMVGNVGWGEMNRWVDFYRDVMGFQLFKHFDDKDISTEYSALMSKVMSNGNGRVKFPINEPAEGKRKSQIEEYLEFYGGPGVQHIAFATGDIIDAVSKLRRQGVEFLRVPSTYYQDLPARTGPIDEPVAALRELGILVDRDDEGYMLQIFTRPVEDRPTLFFEVISARGAAVSAKGISRRCSRLSSANRRSAEICEGGLCIRSRKASLQARRTWVCRKAPTRKSTGARDFTARARTSITRIPRPAGSGSKASCGRTASI